MNTLGLLELKMGDNSLMIEDNDLGNPLMFVNEMTKNLTNEEAYKWIANLAFLGLTTERKEQFEKYRKENPKLVQPDFIQWLQVLSDNLFFDYFNEECKASVDIDRLEELHQGLKSFYNVDGD